TCQALSDLVYNRTRATASADSVQRKWIAKQGHECGEPVRSAAHASNGDAAARRWSAQRRCPQPCSSLPLSAALPSSDSPAQFVAEQVSLRGGLVVLCTEGDRGGSGQRVLHNTLLCVKRVPTMFSNGMTGSGASGTTARRCRRV